MAAEVAFPASIGPFTMAGVNLARAFSAFYRNFGDFPKPDPASDENVMAGLDLAALGWTSFAEIVFCQLSPLHAITLDTETKDAANIPRLATHFAWAYPAVIEEAVLQAAARSHPTEQAFLQYGGYVYFDVRREIIGTNSICPAPLDTPGLVFGRAQALPEKVADVLTRQGRFQESTISELRNRGATEFAWIRPEEFGDCVASPNGCFAYKFVGAPPKYFPVVGKPVFTKNLLAEDLEDSEAWAVVRGEVPAVEGLFIFDKRCSLEENAKRCAQSDNAGDLLLSSAGLSINRESGTGPWMTYEQWQSSADRGAINDPWMFEVSHTSSAVDVCLG